MELPPKHVRFTHTPLDYKNKEIRLVKIEPTTDPSSPIQITMKNIDFSGHSTALTCYREETAALAAKERAAGFRRPVDLESSKEVHERLFQNIFDFIALSYTWGPELPVQDILVTSSERRGWLPVRQNLDDFLVMRRDSDSPWFWIDQICINQGQDDEKSHQVTQMADIYSAAAVEVWLGSGFEGSNKFVDMIAHQTFYPPHHLSKFRLDAVELGWRRGFLRLPYWSRLWVLQEIILGHTVTIRIGLKTILWDKFYEGWRRLEEKVRSLAITETDNDLKHISARIALIYYGRSGRVKDQSWWEVVGLVRGAGCSDPRDRVFGSLGMVHPSRQLIPDYSKQPQSILLELLTREFEFRASEVDHVNHLGEIYTDARETVDTAKLWLPELDDNKNLIDPKSVRRHLLEILPVDSPMFGCKFARTWQLKCYIWKEIPNKQNIYSRLAHAAVRGLELPARDIRRLLQYPKRRRITRKQYAVTRQLYEEPDVSPDSYAGTLHSETSSSASDSSHHLERGES